jgi:hypothetical protein
MQRVHTLLGILSQRLEEPEDFLSCSEEPTSGFISTNTVRSLIFNAFKVYFSIIPIYAKVFKLSTSVRRPF